MADNGETWRGLNAAAGRRLCNQLGRRKEHVLAIGKERPGGTALRLAVSRGEAAAALGVSVDFFDAHVAHELRCVRRGRRRLYAMAELERWLDDNAESALGATA